MSVPVQRLESNAVESAHVGAGASVGQASAAQFEAVLDSEFSDERPSREDQDEGDSRQRSGQEEPDVFLPDPQNGATSVDREFVASVALDPLHLNFERTGAEAADPRSGSSDAQPSRSTIELFAPQSAALGGAALGAASATESGVSGEDDDRAGRFEAELNRGAQPPAQAARDSDLSIAPRPDSPLPEAPVSPDSRAPATVAARAAASAIDPAATTRQATESVLPSQSPGPSEPNESIDKTDPNVPANTTETAGSNPHAVAETREARIQETATVGRPTSDSRVEADTPITRGPAELRVTSAVEREVRISQTDRAESSNHAQRSEVSATPPGDRADDRTGHQPQPGGDQRESLPDDSPARNATREAIDPALRIQMAAAATPEPVETATATVAAAPVEVLARTAAPVGPAAPVSSEAAAPAETIPVHAEWLAARGGGSARIVLHPKELGEVELKVVVHGSRVQVIISAVEPAAQAVAQEYGQILGERLASRDLQLDHFEVRSASREDSPETQRQHKREASEREREQGGSRRATRFAISLDSPTHRAGGVLNGPTDSGVDLRI